ncbi:sporulation protein SpoOM [Paenibacillus sp. FSL A5-0031]|uniref:sporulation protein n=1 Tax=Paenibacillus sp. FSL A5-0031 TaxID=1920420 RepID=UPI00096F18A4|nr:sporulation protein [Paenibacillus sp. FSL A5-0031]OME82085.1 sporulation protein SpoOM [Paenibacillus sp. FSL A5-0031]
MFNRFLASIGIGSAKIDTLLEKARYAPGEEVRGIVKMQGGNVEQRIETIQLSVMTEYIRESNDSKITQQGVVGRYHVSAPFTLQANESREVPFSFQLPHQTPLTIGRAPVWVKTELDVRGGVDPGDNDRIEVVPTHAMNTVLDALNVLGFRLRKAECEYSSRLGGKMPFIQELEFVPTSQFRGQLDELEVMFYPSDRELELVLQIDRRARGLSSFFAEAMDMDETFVRARFTNEQLSAGPNAIAQQLSGIIARYI